MGWFLIWILKTVGGSEANFGVVVPDVLNFGVGGWGNKSIFFGEEVILIEQNSEGSTFLIFRGVNSMSGGSHRHVW